MFPMALKNFLILFRQSAAWTQRSITWANAKNSQIHLFSHRKWGTTSSSALHIVFTSTKTNLRNLQKQFNAFGDHNKCDVLWCANKQNPAEYTHHELPYEKDLLGSSLQEALQDLFSEYASLTVAPKLAPCLHSQRNKSLDGTIGSKNLKVWHYGGSESSDFRTACGVTQNNEGHNFTRETLIKTKIWLYQTSW